MRCDFQRRLRRIGLGVFALFGVVVGLPAQDRVSVPDLFRTAKPTPKSNVSAKSETLLQVSLKKDDKSSSPDGGELYVLSIGLELAPGSYTYPLSRGATFGATKITLSQTTGLEPIGDNFDADREPHAVFEEAIGQTVEKFDDGGVVWSRRFRLVKGASLDAVKLSGRVKFQVCDFSCTPHDESFEATLTAPARVFVTNSREAIAPKTDKPAPPAIDALTAPAAGVAKTDEPAFAKPQPFEIEIVPQRLKKPDPVHARFRLAPENAKQGDPVTLSVTLRLEPDWHTFALDQNPKNVGLPTVIELSSITGLKPADDSFSPSLMPKIERTTDGIEQRVHYTEITWTRQFTVEDKAFGIAGKLRYQICREGQCRPLFPVAFVLGHGPVESAPARAAGAELTGTSDPAVAANVDSQAADLDTLLPFLKGQSIQPVEVHDEKKTDKPAGLGLYLLYAFLGGMILNVMPCVLPVIAIKVLGFVHQSGESRQRVFALNGAYSAGVILVFLVLASLAVFAGYGWGGLFQRTEFQVAMTILVFAMGLSLLGVFEIPVPGLIGSAAGQQHQEGLHGAFLTGVFATLLATPCSGPFLGVTLAWSVKRPPAETYLVWFVMGLGMSSPYLLLGMFPGWVKYLPRPGNWMVTFKQICGFVLLGTVLFLMNSIESRFQLPMLVMLLAIGCALWMIGQLYHINSTASRKWTIRTLAAGMCAATAWWILTPSLQLPWKDFAGTEVNAELQQGRTVLIDFTAEWCLSCKQNEKFALNTSDTLRLVKDHNVVTMKADWTHQPAEITRWLTAFDSISVPLTVIFPAKQPTRPIVIRDLYTKRMLLDKLGQAVQADRTVERTASQR